MGTGKQVVGVGWGVVGGWCVVVCGTVVLFC